MNINEFIGEKAEDKLESVLANLGRVFETTCRASAVTITDKGLHRWDDQTLEDVIWLVGYVKFTKGNRRANQNGLD